MTTRREALENAFAAAGGTDDDMAPQATATDAGGPVDVGDSASRDDVAPLDGSASAAASALPDAGADEGAGTAAQRTRDEQGRFSKQRAEAAAKAEQAKKPLVTVKPTLSKPGATVGAAASQPGEATPPTPPAGDSPKAPQSWKPAAREKFPGLPPEVQAEVTRREREAYAREQETAPMRRVAEQVQQIVGPHAQMFRNEGMEPLQGVSEVLRTYSDLVSGSPERKVGILATLIQGSGVDVEQLAKALDGQPARAQPQQAYQDPRVDQLFTIIQQRGQQRAQEQQAKTRTELAAFSESNEFFEDVRPRMSSLMAGAAQRGEAMSLQEAYDEACWASKTVRGILQQRAAAEAANASPASTQRARAAASSLKSQPASVSNGAPKANTRRASLEAAEAALEKRR